MHLRSLYLHDERRRLISETVQQGRVAPRFVLVRTGDGVQWRVRQDVPDDVAERLAAIVLEEPVMTDPDRPPVRAVAYGDVLGTVDRTGGGPFYTFPRAIGPDASVVEITEATADLVPPELGGRDGIAHGTELPCFGVIVGGRAVSVCRTARLVEDAAQAGVNTMEDYRGRGYAKRAVLVWGRAIRKMRREPIYSTSYENFASRRVAKGAGLTLMGVDYNVY